MSQFVDGPNKSFKTSAAIAKYARVKLASDGTISTAVLADVEIGIAQQDAFASGDIVTVRLRNASGTQKAIALAAIVAGANVYSAAAGKVSVSASGAFNLGKAMEAATASGDIIEIMYATPGAVV